ncbi:MAG: glucose-1-phosphate adenylyltransferase, partial [Propionibacterium sp.]|nr:glucose-1-phosphate adenylyltransferase [Propionibacterium sp.]
FKSNVMPGSTPEDADYWRDVGTIDAYHEAHMDLVSVKPIFNLYNEQWPLLTAQVNQPGAKFVLRGTAEDSIVSPGVIISGGDVDNSVLSPNVHVDKWADVEHSVLLDNVRIGRNSVVRRAILDKNVIVENGAEVGVDHEADRARGFTVSDGGITVVGKGMRVSAI